LDPTAPVYLFLGGHALGLAGSGLLSDIWAPFRKAGLAWAAPICLALTLLTAFAPAVALVTFPLLGLVAAWGIVAWAPAFKAVVPLRRRAIAFAGVPIAANAFKYIWSLGIGHVQPAWLVVLATLPLVASVAYGPRLRGVDVEGPMMAAATPAVPFPDLRPLWQLAPFLFVVYLASGVTYAAVTPSLLRALHSSVDPSLLAYVVSIPVLAIFGDRTTLRNVAFAGPLLLGAAFLVWAASPNAGGAAFVQVLMGAGYAAMDLLTWVALLEIAPSYGTATVFGIGLNMNVLPILIGAGLQAQVPALARLPNSTLAGGMLFLMLLAIVFFRDTPLLVRAPNSSRLAELPLDALDAHAIEASPAPTTADRLGLDLADMATTPLSPRELEVARLVIQGMTVGEMAKELIVSENTVKTHLASVYRKTGTHGRAELSARVLAGDDRGR
jgi:DNA-binding CsgD family transcriptional regulator